MVVTIRCSSPASPNGQHHWDIDTASHGRCLYCSAERDFFPSLEFKEDLKLKVVPEPRTVETYHVEKAE